MSAEPVLAWYQYCVSVPDRVGATAKPCGLISGVGSVEMNGADLIIVGGGSAGAALAGLIARDQSVSVLLLEAGPDYGHQRAGQCLQQELTRGQHVPLAESAPLEAGAQLPTPAHLQVPPPRPSVPSC